MNTIGGIPFNSTDIAQFISNQYFPYYLAALAAGIVVIILMILSEIYFFLLVTSSIFSAADIQGKINEEDLTKALTKIKSNYQDLPDRSRLNKFIRRYFLDLIPSTIKEGDIKNIPENIDNYVNEKLNKSRIYMHKVTTSWFELIEWFGLIGLITYVAIQTKDVVVLLLLFISYFILFLYIQSIYLTIWIKKRSFRSLLKISKFPMKGNSTPFSSESLDGQAISLKSLKVLFINYLYSVRIYAVYFKDILCWIKLPFQTMISDSIIALIYIIFCLLTTYIIIKLIK